MKDIKDLEAWDNATCKEQIAIRYKIIGEMVGTLYPSILVDEVTKIRRRQAHQQPGKGE